MSAHLDEFTLLRYAARDLVGDEHRIAVSHLASCDACGGVLGELRELDAELRQLAAEGGFDEPLASALGANDPFRQRPQIARRRRAAPRSGENVIPRALAASEVAGTLQRSILEAVKDADRLAALLGELSLEEPEQRFALLYALQEAGRRIAESPSAAMEFAEAALRRLSGESVVGSGVVGEAGETVPSRVISGQAHVLAGQACIWAKQFAKARLHLVRAYRDFARGGADETSLAIVELTESQRRSFVREGAAAFALARRARRTFEVRGLEDLAARAMVAEGLACFTLGRLEESVSSYRAALPVFERYELWTNYVGAQNSIGVSLYKLGRVDEARRDYARALRRFSREQHKSWLGFLREGLGEILFSAGRFREAAIAFARASGLYSESGLRPNALIALLREAEAWLRQGEAGRARHRLQIFLNEVTRDRTLDPAVLRELAEDLSGTEPDFARIAELRQQVVNQLQQTSSAARR